MRSTQRLGIFLFGLLTSASALAAPKISAHRHDGVYVGVMKNRVHDLPVSLPAAIERQPSRVTLRRDGSLLHVHTELGAGKQATLLRAVGRVVSEGAGTAPGATRVTVHFTGSDYLSTAQGLVDSLAAQLSGPRIRLTGGESRQTFTFAADGSLELEAEHAIDRAPFGGLAGFVANRLIPPRIRSQSSGSLTRE